MVGRGGWSVGVVCNHREGAWLCRGRGRGYAGEMGVTAREITTAVDTSDTTRGTVHYNILYSVQYTLYNIHCIIYTVHYTLYTIHCIIYTVRYTVYSVHIDVQSSTYSEYTVYRDSLTLYSVFLLLAYTHTYTRKHTNTHTHTHTHTHTYVMHWCGRHVTQLKKLWCTMQLYGSICIYYVTHQVLTFTYTHIYIYVYKNGSWT